MHSVKYECIQYRKSCKYSFFVSSRSSELACIFYDCHGVIEKKGVRKKLHIYVHKGCFACNFHEQRGHIKFIAGSSGEKMKYFTLIE